MSRNTDQIANNIADGLEAIVKNYNNASTLGTSVQIPEDVTAMFRGHIKGRIAPFAPEIDKVEEDDERLKKHVPANG